MLGSQAIGSCFHFWTQLKSASSESLVLNFFVSTFSALRGYAYRSRALRPFCRSCFRNEKESLFLSSRCFGACSQSDRECSAEQSETTARLRFQQNGVLVRVNSLLLSLLLFKSFPGSHDNAESGEMCDHTLCNRFSSYKYDAL